MIISYFSFGLYGQVMMNYVANASYNISGATIYVSCTSGNEATYISAINLNFDSVTLKSFYGSVSFAYNWEDLTMNTFGTTAYKSNYFDYKIYPSPNTLWETLTVYIYMPQVSSIYYPAMSICKAEIIYVGCSLECVEPDVLNNVNNGFIQYQNMFV